MSLDLIHVERRDILLDVKRFKKEEYGGHSSSISIFTEFREFTFESQSPFLLQIFMLQTDFLCLRCMRYLPLNIFLPHFISLLNDTLAGFGNNI